jgi:hypothetical protein
MIDRTARSTALLLATFCTLPAACAGGAGSRTIEVVWLGRGSGLEQQVTDEHGATKRWRLLLHDRDLRLLLDDRGAVFEDATDAQGIRYWVGDVRTGPDYTIELAGDRRLVWRDDVLEVDGQRYRLAERGTMIFAADGTVGRATLPWDEW